MKMRIMTWLRNEPFRICDTDASLHGGSGAGAVSFCPEKKNRYLAVFTGWNLVFLAGLWVLHLCL